MKYSITMTQRERLLDLDTTAQATITVRMFKAISSESTMQTAPSLSDTSYAVFCSDPISVANQRGYGLR